MVIQTEPIVFMYLVTQAHNPPPHQQAHLKERRLLIPERVQVMVWREKKYKEKMQLYYNLRKSLKDKQ